MKNGVQSNGYELTCVLLTLRRKLTKWALQQLNGESKYNSEVIREKKTKQEM